MLVGRHRAQVLEGESGRVAYRPADFQGSVVGGHRKVAADVVQLGGRDLPREGGGRGLRVEGSRVDHQQRGTCRLEIVRCCHGLGLLEAVGRRVLSCLSSRGR